MRKKSNIILVLTLLVLGLLACTKLETNSLVTIKAQEITLVENIKDTTLMTNVVAYSFVVDTAEWSVENYADALAGVITSRKGGSTKEYDQKQEVNNGEFQFNFIQSPQMVIVCSKDQSTYAYRGVIVPENLADMSLGVTFETWQVNKDEFKNGWHYVYEGCLVTVGAQEITAEDAVPIPMNELVAYSFAADPKDWRVKNYTDALKGVITSRTDKNYTQNYDQAPKINIDDSEFLFSFRQAPQMIVVCSKTQFAYAYREVIISENFADISLDIEFQTWKTNTTYVEDGWTYVFDDCSVIIRAQEIVAENAEPQMITDLIAYSFAADPKDWHVEKYEYALAGVISSNVDNSIKKYNQIQNINDNSEILFSFKQSPQMVVVCSETKPAYAYRGIVIHGDMDVMTLGITFQTWQTNTTYVENGWTYVFE